MGQGHRPRNQTFVRIAAETWQPFFLINKDVDGKTTYSGIMWEVLKLISSMMNLRFEILRPPDGLWGVEQANGSWNGMLGMIQRKDVDIALGPFAISYPRTKVAEFPPALFVFPHWLFLPRPRGSSDLSDFVRLFHPVVWFSILGTGFFLVIIIYGAAKLKWTSLPISSRRKNEHQQSAQWTPSFSILLLHIWGVLFQVSIAWNIPRGARILMSLWMLGTLILMRTYSSLLVASLTVPSVPVPIRSVEDLVAQTRIPWRLEQGGIILHTFKTADVKMYKNLLERSTGFFPDCYAARDDIAKGHFAGICDSLSGNLMVAKTFSDTAKCNYFTPRETIVTHSYTLVLQRNSPLMESLRFWLQELQEHGWIDQLINQVVNNGTKCQLPPGREEGQPPAVALNIAQMWGAFAILASGICGAALVFFIEFCAQRMT
ncbi:glutamate receptor ionotropic, delta-2-like [Palaemon carinicauda]|uniref:glutamate receptor ionotropic, delta-2-like n=1 Tax=Palaemon carinicauda TaxID=392227 RepID=UPI0035B674D5